ncbi:MAG: hypothetical protein ACI4TM_03605 [Candidatus Cryptobacteroides sp.]
MIEMKIFSRALTLFAVIPAFAICCAKPEVQNPADDGNGQGNGNVDDEPAVIVFPEKQTVEMTAGETWTLAFEAKTDWEVTVPTSVASWFWIQDGGQKVYRLSGKAGNVSVDICLSERKDFDQAPVCEVSLKMGDETRVVAELKRVTEVRSFAIYDCRIDEDGYFLNDEDGGYDYSDTPAESLTLVWPEGVTGFSLPIKIEANFDWILYDCPDWTDFTVTEGVADSQTILRIVGVSTKYPIDGDSSELVFGDASNSAYTFTIPVSIPACRDYFVVDMPAEAEFNVEGKYFNELADAYVDGGIFGSVTSVNGSRVFLAEAFEDGWKAGSNVSGATLSLGMWDITSKEVIQSRRISLNLSANTSDTPRRLYLMVLPAFAMPSGFVPETDLLDAEGMGISPDYQKYVYTEIYQQGKESEGGGEDVKDEDVSDPSDPNTWDIKFEYPNLVQGARLNKYVSGPLFDQFKEYGAPVYELVYFNENGKCGYTPMLKLPSYSSVVASDKWLTYEGSAASFHIYMDAKTYSRGNILFYNSKNEVMIVLVCTLDI